MHSKPLLLLLPFAFPLAAAADEDRNFFDKAGDSVKGLFGDPVAMVNNLPRCQGVCLAMSVLELKLDKAALSACKDRKIVVDCLCSDGGKSLEGSIRQCGDDIKSRADADASNLKCDDDDFDEIEAVKICEAVLKSPEKGNDTQQAIKNFITDDLFVWKSSQGFGGNGTEDGKLSSAAAGFGAVSKAAAGVLAVAAGYALAMM